MSDSQSGVLSFFGRVADDLRREPVSAGDYEVALTPPRARALYKHDGHFVFSDLPLSPTPYTFALTSGLYQARTFAKALPGPPPVEVTYDGEDELYVALKSVNVASKQVTFDAIPFLPPVRQGAVVLGEGGFATTLADDLAGVDVTTATLTSVTGLAATQLLRFVRSHNLRAKAGPYYPFPEATTVLAVKVVEDAPAEPPLAGARVRLTKVNTLVPASTTVAGVALRHVSLVGPPAQQPILGTTADLDAFTDGRGHAVHYFPGHWNLTALEIEVSRAGYVASTAVVPTVAGQRTSVTRKLVPV